MTGLLLWHLSPVWRGSRLYSSPAKTWNIPIIGCCLALFSKQAHDSNVYTCTPFKIITSIIFSLVGFTVPCCFDMDLSPTALAASSLVPCEEERGQKQERNSHRALPRAPTAPARGSQQLQIDNPPEGHSVLTQASPSQSFFFFVFFQRFWCITQAWRWKYQFAPIWCDKFDCDITTGSWSMVTDGQQFK